MMVNRNRREFCLMSRPYIDLSRTHPEPDHVGTQSEFHSIVYRRYAQTDQNAIPLVHHVSPRCHLTTSSNPPQHHHPSLASAPNPKPRSSETGIGSNNHTPPRAKSSQSKCAV